MTSGYVVVDSSIGTEVDNPTQEYNRGLKTMLNHVRDDMTPVPDIGERSTLDKASDGTKRRPELQELTRFTMVKRIW